MVRRIMLSSVLVLMASSHAWAQDLLGIDVPVQDLGTSLWQALGIGVGSLAGVLALIALIYNHMAFFMTMLVICVGIFAIGFGIPNMIGAAGWTWVF